MSTGEFNQLDVSPCTESRNFPPNPLLFWYPPPHSLWKSYVCSPRTTASEMAPTTASTELALTTSSTRRYPWSRTSRWSTESRDVIQRCRDFHGNVMEIFHKIVLVCKNTVFKRTEQKSHTFKADSIHEITWLKSHDDTEWIPRPRPEVGATAVWMKTKLRYCRFGRRRGARHRSLDPGRRRISNVTSAATG